jgi:hypothetical protein
MRLYSRPGTRKKTQDLKTERPMVRINKKQRRKHRRSARENAAEAERLALKAPELAAPMRGLPIHIA